MVHDVALTANALAVVAEILASTCLAVDDITVLYLEVDRGKKPVGIFVDRKRGPNVA